MTAMPADTDHPLTDYDRIRYQRQMLIWDWGEAGQARLKASRVLIAGAGGLGSPVALYPAAAGAGGRNAVQARLKASRVLIAGAGGRGSPVAMYLAAAGVGELRLCDVDRVEL